MENLDALFLTVKRLMCLISDNERAIQDLNFKFLDLDLRIIHLNDRLTLVEKNWE